MQSNCTDSVLSALTANGSFLASANRDPLWAGYARDRVLNAKHILCHFTMPPLQSTNPKWHNVYSEESHGVGKA